MRPIAGTAPRFRYTASNANVVCDGNSITGGQVWTTQTYPMQLSALAPIASQLNALNLGVSGQTIRQMNGLDGGSSSDVDGAYVAGKKNILVVLGGTNDIDPHVAGLSGAKSAQNLADYVTARLAAHPGWYVMMMTCPPFIYDGWDTATSAIYNAQVDAFNASIRANYRTWGARQLVEFRAAGSLFDMGGDYSLANFETPARMNYWAPEATGKHIHPKDTGAGYIAGLVAAALKRVPAR